MNNIIHFETEKENSFCFDFLEEKIREESRKLIESIYADEVQQFLDNISSAVDDKAKAIESARKFLSMKLLTHEQIAEGVGLPLEKIEELALEIDTAK